MKKLKDVMRKGVAPKSTFGTNPLDPWSTKSNITEGRTSLLNKFILSKGIEPSSLSTDSLIAYSKTLEFAKWVRDRKMRGESVDNSIIQEAVDRKDTVTINIPLMIRLLELAREDVKTDMELHHIVERLINIRGRGVLGMDHYNYIAGKSRKVFKEETTDRKDAANYTVHTSTGVHSVYGPGHDHEAMTKHLHRQMGGHGKIIYGDIKKIEPYTGSVANTRDPKSNRSYNESINKMSNGDDSCLDEMAGANMDTRAVHQHLKKAGWNLTRTTGSHDVFTHKNSKEHIPVPRHRQLKAPLVQGILKTSKMIMDDVELEEDKFQDPQAATQTVGMEVESKKRFKSLRPVKNVKEDMYDAEKEDKSVQTYGKKPKFKKTDDTDNNESDEVTARSTLSGGKTLTGQTRDTVEIDPSMRKRLDPTRASKTRKTTEKK
jgi:predicted RNA binding protein YcfA (HicA-like mRNA interferase family)